MKSLRCLRYEKIRDEIERIGESIRGNNMDYLKILHEDSNLAADFDALFDFFLLDEPTERDEIEEKCTFSMDGKAFARDGAGGEYHQLEDGSIRYMSSEGECGRIAESIDDLIYLLVYSICWHDYCDSRKYTDVGILESYAKERYAQITSYTDMDKWEYVVKALGMPSEANLAAVLQKFYDATNREPLYQGFYHEEDGSITPYEGLFF